MRKRPYHPAHTRPGGGRTRVFVKPFVGEPPRLRCRRDAARAAGSAKVLRREELLSDEPRVLDGGVIDGAMSMRAARAEAVPVDGALTTHDELSEPRDRRRAAARGRGRPVDRLRGSGRAARWRRRRHSDPAASCRWRWWSRGNYDMTSTSMRTVAATTPRETARRRWEDELLERVRVPVLGPGGAGVSRRCRAAAATSRCAQRRVGSGRGRSGRGVEGAASPVSPSANAIRAARSRWKSRMRGIAAGSAERGLEPVSKAARRRAPSARRGARGCARDRRGQTRGGRVSATKGVTLTGTARTTRTTAARVAAALGRDVADVTDEVRRPGGVCGACTVIRDASREAASCSQPRSRRRDHDTAGFRARGSSPAAARFHEHHAAQCVRNPGCCCAPSQLRDADAAMSRDEIRRDARQSVSLHGYTDIVDAIEDAQRKASRETGEITLKAEELRVAPPLRARPGREDRRNDASSGDLAFAGMRTRGWWRAGAEGAVTGATSRPRSVPGVGGAVGEDVPKNEIRSTCRQTMPSAR